ncbi:MAG: hypothetical protein AAF208_05095 [Cyanobacteria bacterium P01_A01_bin.45]
MFSKISQKAALIGMTAITSFTVMGSFMIDSAQAAQSSIFNSEAVAENSVSSLNTSQLEVASFIRRGKIRQKPTAGYKVRQGTDDNTPGSVNSTDTNQSSSSFIRRGKIRQKPTAGY